MTSSKTSKKPPYFERWRSVPIGSDGARHCVAVTTNAGELIKKEFANVENVYDVFLNGLKLSNDKSCVAWRKGDRYVSASFETVGNNVKLLAKALRTRAGLKQQDIVGLYSANSSQWMVTALACASNGLVLVPLYDTLGSEATCAIIEEVEMPVLFVDTVDACRRVLTRLSTGERKFSIKKIVLLGPIGQFSAEPIPDDLNELAQSNDVTILHVSTLVSGVKALKEEDSAWSAPKRDDLYMIQYTSGTTGVPKGVMLTHGNFVANLAGIHSVYDVASAPGYTMHDCGILTCLHYLPLAHSYGQLLALSVLYYGGAIALFSGNVANLGEDAQLYRPIVMPLVPRLMNKVYSKVMAELDSKGPLAQKLFWFAYNRKVQMVRRGVLTRSTIWDRLIFRKLQMKLGGRAKFMLTASAPVGAEVLEFFRVAFGAHIVEAYGQTECTALVTAAMDPDGGNVGHPATCNAVKLSDVPEMNLVASSGRGEICVKGDNVTIGYYKRPDLTDDVIDPDGWLHTGDIGEFTPSGALRIVDRKKHIFKLAQGEYISPEKIESIYACAPLVGQVFVDGSSLQWFTVAIVVPDPVGAKEWAIRESLIDPGEPNNNEICMKTFCENRDFQRYVLNTLRELGQEKGLNQLEQIRSLWLEPELFSVENDLLTPSMKNRRPQLRSHFKAQIDKMYNDGPMVNGKRS